MICQLPSPLNAGAGVAKFCAKYLHEQVLKNEACSAGDLGGSVRKAFLRLVFFFLTFFLPFPLIPF